jgi:hypothetical protein
MLDHWLLDRNVWRYKMWRRGLEDVGGWAWMDNGRFGVAKYIEGVQT